MQGKRPNQATARSWGTACKMCVFGCCQCQTQTPSSVWNIVWCGTYNLWALVAPGGLASDRPWKFGYAIAWCALPLPLGVAAGETRNSYRPPVCHLMLEKLATPDSCGWVAQAVA